MDCDPVLLDDALAEEFHALRPGGEAHGTTKEQLWSRVHQLKDEQALTALCLSGGGIRSATFGLGVIQGLARAGLLDKFDYLSTVSGGGYIGGWLTSWIHRHPRQLAGVIDDLQAAAPTPPLVPGGYRSPVQWLREYSNYLSPALGVSSPDSWTLIATVLRNLILNWVVLLPLLVAGLLLPRISAALLRDFGAEFALAALLTGAALIAVATSEIAVCWPGRPEARKESYLLGRLLLPLVAGCWLKCIGYFQLARQPGFVQDQPLLAFLLLGAAIHTSGWVIGWFRTWAAMPVAGWIAAPLTGAAGGAAAWAGAYWLLNPAWVEPVRYVTFAVPALILLLALGGVLFVGFASHRETWMNDAAREWWARCGAWMLIAAAGWTAFHALVLYGPLLLIWLQGWNWVTGVGGAGAGVLAALAGWFGPKADGGGLMATLRPRLMRIAERLLAPIASFLLLAALSLTTSAAILGGWPSTPGQHLEAVFARPWLLVQLPLLAGLLWLFSSLCCRVLSVNRFTLHHMYRNRLIRAYLGATRVEPKHPRHQDEITGFDPQDNLLLQSIRPTQRPLHLLNFALNLTSGKRLAWQQRKAASFTASPLRIGSWLLAYQKPKCYTDEGGLSLGTAIAISGAAATPNMGYHTSRVLTFLMTIFNLRLGGWFPNPARRDPQLLGKASPDAPGWLVAELLGQTGSDGDWVYLSDGGHFENLGLYEAVRRRCRFIVASDASCDPKRHATDLANAIQKIRVDFGIPIEYAGQPDFHGSLDSEGDHFALLRIGYAAADGPGVADGWILYLKPALSRGLPADVQAYAAATPAFPHQTTADQFYSENQFEAYRHLGEETVRRLAGPLHGSLVDVFRSHTGSASRPAMAGR